MAGKHWLDWRDGYLCVVSEYMGYDLPQAERLWYPVEECTQHQAKHLIGSPCTPNHYSGYTARVSGAEMDIGCSSPYKQPDYDLTIRLKDGGQTYPIHVENIPIPCPKVKKGTQTRWMNQRWQKYTSKGWVTA